MKIHFWASAARPESVKKIPQILKGLGHQVTVELLEAEKRTKTDVASEKKAEAVIIEIAKDTPLLGFRLASVLMEKKPILLLYLEGSKVGDLRALVGDKFFRYLTVASYDPENLNRVLKDYFKSLSEEKEAAARFNFILNSDLEKFLNWVPFGKKTAKSDFVRELIREAMEEDEEYRAFLKKKR